MKPTKTTDVIPSEPAREGELRRSLKNAIRDKINELHDQGLIDKEKPLPIHIERDDGQTYDG